MGVTMALCLANGFAGEPETKEPEVTELEVEFDLKPATRFLYGKIAPYSEAPEVKGVSCKAPALRVAKVALFQYDLQIHLRSVAKDTFKGISVAAKLAGAKTVSKAAQIAGDVVAAYDTDQPEAALGRLLIKNSVGWAKGKADKLPKMGKDKIDEKLKEEAEELADKVQEKLTETLFRGDLSPGITKNYTTYPYGFCSPASVTVEYQKAGAPLPGGQNGPPKSLRGGLFVMIRGECQCVNENTAELRSYHVSFLMPQTGLDARLETDKGQLLLDTAALVKAARATFKDAKKKYVKDPKAAEKKDEKEEEPKSLKELAQELADKVKGVELSMKLILTPRFAMPPLDEIIIHDTCGCRGGNTGQPGAGVTETPPEPEYIPAAGDCPPCSALYVKWEKLTEKWKHEKREEETAETQLRQADADAQVARRILKLLDTDKNYAKSMSPQQRKSKRMEANSELSNATLKIHKAQDALAKNKGRWQATEAAAAAAGGEYEACKREKCPPRDKGINRIDPCLVGTWEARDVAQFAGYRVTFTASGTQTVDYTKAQPLQYGNNESTTWAGVGTDVIATKNGGATILESRPGSVTMTLVTPVTRTPVVWKFGTLMGLAGLGSTTGDNKYVCTRTRTMEKGSDDSQGDTLTYQGSTHRDRHPNYAVKLTRIKP